MQKSSNLTNIISDGLVQPPTSFLWSHTCSAPFVFLVFMLQVCCSFAHSRTIMDVPTDHLRSIVWKLVHTFARSIARTFKTFPWWCKVFTRFSFFLDFVVSGGWTVLSFFTAQLVLIGVAFGGRIANTPPGALLIGEGNMFQRINRYRHPPNSCMCFRHVWGSKYLLRRCFDV